jgi:hypothetical protein
MANKRHQNRKLIFSLAILWCSFACFCLYNGAYDSLILWIVLPLMYAPLVYFSWRTNYLVLFLFILAAAATNALTPAIFFLKKDEYSAAGWNSINQFDFKVGNYLYINSYLVAFYIFVVLSTLIINRVFRTRKYKEVLHESSSLAEAADKKNPSKQESLSYGLSVVFCVVAFGLLNEWMFTKGIALTGLTGQQGALPFKLGGILYYFTRFIVPLIIFHFYSHSSRSLPLTVLIACYAMFAGLSQVSRFTFAMIIFPVLYFAVTDQKYRRLFLVGALSLFGFLLISQAREFVYLVTEDTVTMNPGADILSMARSASSEFRDVDVISVLYSMVNRVGGAQDIVLGFQYDTQGTGGSWANFRRIFLMDSRIAGDVVGYELYGVDLPAGFSVGSGGFSSQMLQIAGGHLIVLSVLAFWVGFWISLGDKLFCEYIQIFKRFDIAFTFAIFFMALFFAAGQIAWFYAFMGISLLVVLYRRKPTYWHRISIGRVS